MADKKIRFFGFWVSCMAVPLSVSAQTAPETVSQAIHQSVSDSSAETASTGRAGPPLIEVVAERVPFSDAGQKLTDIAVVPEKSERLDQALGRVPGISLFRRADSYSAHPTAQGVSMRGVGANGAGRVLVTLDGVPQNDPFGGWVYWSALPTDEVGHVTVRAGGNPGAFGSQALSGVIELKTKRREQSGGALRIGYGSFDTTQAAGNYTVVGDNGFLHFAGGLERTDGFYLIPADQRGPVDAKATSDVSRTSIEGGTRIGSAEMVSTLRWYKEDRINGVEAAINGTEAVDASVRLTGADARWEVISYYRTRDFANIFASVRDGRTTERPVLDQYDVPGTGYGMLARVRLGAVEVGIDGRRMTGSVYERYRNLGSGFTREREAGGDQWMVGLYGETSAVFSNGEISFGARLDRYRSYNGVRLETDLESGDITREDTINPRSGWVPTGRVGVSYDLEGGATLTAALYRSWRLPTLNEYYRPFRVVNDITEANPDLAPEKLTGAEIGIGKDLGDGTYVYAGLYRNWLADGVGNVTIGFGPGFFDLGGFVPPGGVLRQRANIDRMVTDGLELEAGVRMSPALSLSASYQYARARITAFADNPGLVGKRPVQTPRHNLRAEMRFEGEKLSASADVMFQSGQYDDDLNERYLGSIFLVGVSAVYPVAESVDIGLSATNIFGTKVLSALTADGLETIARRRRLMVTMAVRF